MYLQEQKAMLENEVLRKQVRTKLNSKVKTMDYVKLTFHIQKQSIFLLIFNLQL